MAFSGMVWYWVVRAGGSQAPGPTALEFCPQQLVDLALPSAQRQA